MVRRYRDLTTKYKWIRHKPDTMYSSRSLNTLFNKFIRKGKKAYARKHFLKALETLRYAFQQPRTFNVINELIRNLHAPLVILPKRKGSETVMVPVPLWRNKRDSFGVQKIYEASKAQEGRELHWRIYRELNSEALDPKHSAALRQRDKNFRQAFDERANDHLRWR